MSKIITGNSSWDYFFVSLFTIWQLRCTLFELFAASFPYKWNKSYQKAKAIREEQSLFDRFTFRYTKDYICDRLKTTHKAFMIFKIVYDIWFTVCTACLILFKSNLISFAYSDIICEVIGSVATAIAIVFLLFYNPLTHSTRFINFKFPKR